MSIHYGPGYDPLDQPGSGAGLPSVASWNDLLGLEPASVGKEVIVTSIPGASNEGALARRGTNSWYIPGMQNVVQDYVNDNPIPAKMPSAPRRRRILGRTTNTQGGVFDTGTNNPGWWGYGSYGITGPTRITVDTRIVNQTGKDIEKIAIPFFGTATDNAQILAVWVGRGGASDHTTDSIQRLTFGGQNTIKPGSGTQYLPTTVITDLTTLNSVWAKNEEILIRVVFENSGQVEAFDSFGTMANAESGLARCWIGIGDAGSSAGTLGNAATLTWVGNWMAPFCQVFAEFTANETPEVSVLVCGDSVVNQWKSYLDTNSMIRDGWQYFLEQYNTSNTWHVTTAGNGGYDVPQYCDRLMSTLSLYVGWVHVICLEGWTPNGTMLDMATFGVWKSKIVTLHSMVEDAGMDWLVVFNSPIGKEVMDIPDLANAQPLQMATIAWHNAKYPGRIIDMRASMADANNPDYFNPAYSLDDAHYTRAGNIRWATDFKPLMENRLQQKLGYTL